MSMKEKRYWNFPCLQLSSSHGSLTFAQGNDVRHAEGYHKLWLQWKSWNLVGRTVYNKPANNASLPFTRTPEDRQRQYFVLFYSVLLIMLHALQLCINLLCCLMLFLLGKHFLKWICSVPKPSLGYILSVLFVLLVLFLKSIPA